MWNSTISVLVILILSLVTGTVTADQQTNAARLTVQSYECVTAPNYWGWKAPSYHDNGQLTDGRVLDTWDIPEGNEYYASRMVLGWSAKDPVVIVFDLGEVRSVGGIRLHSALSPWGSYWPKELKVLVSGDNTHFYSAGPVQGTAEMVVDPPASKEAIEAARDRTLISSGMKPSTHWIRVDGLKGRGRYVSLVISGESDAGNISVDEIEIYEGRADAVQSSRAQVFSEGKGGWKSYLLATAISGRITRDISTLKEKIGRSGIAASERNRLLARLRDVEKKLTEMPVPETGSFRAVVPVNALHREVFSVQAALWRAQGAPEIGVWQSHRWDPVTPLDEPRGKASAIQVTMAENEVRSDVLNLTNASPKDRLVTVRLTGAVQRGVEVFKVLTVDTRKLEVVTAAMLPAARQGDGYVIPVPAGTTRQVWLRWSSKSLGAGKYQGSIELTSDGKKISPASIPASVEVRPVKMPDRFTLRLGGWDYAIVKSYEVTSENQQQFVSVLREYGVNTAWSAGHVMPMGSYDDEGNLISPPSRELVDEWFRLWPDASLYCIFNPDCLLPADAPNREKRVEAWAKDWAEYLRGRGVSPDRFVFLLRDEPTTEAELKVILEIGRAIKKGAPEMKVFNDLHFKDPLKAPAIIGDVMRETCDIQCFNRSQYFAEPGSNDAFKNQYDRPGLEWWTYTAGPNNRLSDPYVNLLLQEWFCIDKGLTGSHFWAFGDSYGGSSWNEYLNSGVSPTPLYLTKDSVTTSKYMEALREGAEDYGILLMLRNELARHEGGSSAVVQQAREILEQGVREVLSVHSPDYWDWSINKDRSTADSVRIQAVRALEELRRTTD